MNDEIHAYVLQENKRIISALSTVADYLHKGNISMALTLIESLVNGDVSERDNLDQDQSARVAIFGRQFNRWCINQRLIAGWVAMLPSKSVEGYTSIQVGGAAQVCALIEKMHKGE